MGPPHDAGEGVALAAPAGEPGAEKDWDMGEMERKDDAPDTGRHFLRQWIAEEVAAGLPGGQVVTRFPPEPNGWLHIGHAKAICIDFGMAGEFGGVCNLRMDDTNPSKESEDYVRAIQNDVRWLGFAWDRFVYASDYFEQMYAIAEGLIRGGHAYVCELSQEQWKAYRGVPAQPGTPSPFRDRSPDENLALFRQMRGGAYLLHLLTGQSYLSGAGKSTFSFLPVRRYFAFFAFDNFTQIQRAFNAPGVGAVCFRTNQSSKAKTTGNGRHRTDTRAAGMSVFRFDKCSRPVT